MLSTLLGSSFGSLLALVIWVALPLYAAALTLAVVSKVGPTTHVGNDNAEQPESWAPLGGAQAPLLGAAVALISLYRGYEGVFAQGQLILTLGGTRLQAVVWGLGFLGIFFLAPSAQQNRSTHTHAGVTPLAVAPLLLALWSLLPMVTHITTALLVLELVGAALLWAIASAPARGVGPCQAESAGLANGIVLFVWASGLSALGLLLGLGLNGLGSGLHGSLPLGLVAGLAPQGGALVTLALSLKFLVGGGQFLLMAWYRYLSGESLAFYLTFYYPAHLVVGLSVLGGLALAHFQGVLVIILASLGLALISLVPHIGAQSSPATTLAGSSFVGLALLVLALVA